MPRPHHVVIVAFPGIELLDATGPAEVFSVASRVGGADRPGYVVRIATADGGPVTTSSGVRPPADRGGGRAYRTAIPTRQVSSSVSALL
ncbi:hypothetical protein ACFVUH_21890 [Kitasatospora sp. NPDC058032]|uniref:hypothetical protein n=1 Tax=Kitasatospora sp. NPDC058032 TaxID=3346307 RepID=UPI0036D85BB4